MAELLKLFNTYLGPASDTLLDLGASNRRWKNFYLQSAISSNTTDFATMLSNSANISVLISSRMTILDSGGISVISGNYSVMNSGMFVSFLNTIGVIDSATVTVLQNSLMTAGSATVNTLITTNDSRATLNTVVLQQTALTVQAGDMWFMASSNQLFLFCRSNNINFYVAMGTTNAYPAL